MMKHEFEALAGYEVSVSDYDNIIEHMLSRQMKKTAKNTGWTMKKASSFLSTRKGSEMFWCGTKNRWCSVWSCRRQQCEFTGKEGGQQMYKRVNGEWTNDDYSKSKTVRLYPETLEVIEGYRGKNFSEKLRNLVKDFARQNQENARQNGGNEAV